MPIDMSDSASETAIFVAQQRRNNLEHLQESNALGFVAKGVFQHLEEVFEECSTVGWDGEQAKPISGEVLLYAQKFLNSFPLGIEAPEISAESDGAITLEWYRSPNRVLSISINPNGWVYYAAIMGTSKRHGSDFALMGISRDLLNLISQITMDN
jgi:hypothetical protein